LLKRYVLTLGIIFFIILSAIAPSSYGNVIKTINSRNESNILYVGGIGPGNYTKIQDAIDNSSINNTVFVYDDSSPYYENVVIDKSISLIGEDRNTTVIDGSGNSDVVKTTADSVLLSFFTIQNSGNNHTDAGIHIFSDYNIIRGNNIFHNDEGIFIQNSNNTLITSNNMSSNDYGLWLSDQSSNNTVISNIFNYNVWRGIYIDESGYNIFSNNDISDNGNGIYLIKSDNNYLINNIITNNWYGIDLISSCSNSILNNTFLNDDLYVFDSYQNKIFNNTVDNKPLVYLEDESDIIIDKIVGQIIIINCINITVQNQQLSNLVHSIVVWESKFCTISENSIINNYYGIVIYNSSNNCIIDNNISNNRYGIVFDYSGDNNSIIKNIISNNTDGVSILNIDNTTLIARNNFSKNRFGIHVYKSKNTLILNNSFSMDFIGIYLFFKSNNNTINSNNFINCDDGIWIRLVTDNIICENRIISSESDGIGIWILGSYYNLVSNNTIKGCFISIDIGNSYNNTILDNIFFKGGISVQNSFQNIVSSNIINDKPLVYLEEKSKINIEDAGQVILIKCNNIFIENQNLSNTFIGVELWESNFCNILNNTLSNNHHGLYILNSHNINISNNNILNYYSFGINSYSSNDNTYFKNNIHIENEVIKNIVFPYKTMTAIDTAFHKLNLEELRSYYNSFSYDIINDIAQSDIHPYLFYKDISSNSSKGISIISCINNIILENKIQKNQEGIFFEDSSSCLIKQNNFKKNDRGIYFDSSSQNKIIQNNFIKNKNHAFFIDSKNIWIGNYWNRPRFLPKFVIGRILFYSLSIPWFDIDWNPVKNPYNI